MHLVHTAKMIHCINLCVLCHEKTVIVIQSRSFQLYSPSASYIASQLYLACAKLYCPTGSLGGEYNITEANWLQYNFHAVKI